MASACLSPARRAAPNLNHENRDYRFTDRFADSVFWHIPIREIPAALPAHRLQCPSSLPRISDKVRRRSFAADDVYSGVHPPFPELRRWLVLRWKRLLTRDTHPLRRPRRPSRLSLHTVRAQTSLGRHSWMCRENPWSLPGLRHFNILIRENFVSPHLREGGIKYRSSRKRQQPLSRKNLGHLCDRSDLQFVELQFSPELATEEEEVEAGLQNLRSDGEVPDLTDLESGRTRK